MEDKITDADIEQLCRENVLANEQLRRIRAERMVKEVQQAQEKCSCQDGN
tara:strand:- start:212 stop:361 length:150 start_codon:yes stop_codon:yes gene_type:complete